MDTGLYQKYHATFRVIRITWLGGGGAAERSRSKPGVFLAPGICYIIMNMKDDLHAGEETFNATMRKFGAPDSRIQGYEYWSVLLRHPQVTLGSIILAAHGSATSWAGLVPGSFDELQRVVSELEAALKKAFHYEKLNYLMLMMVDPHVHFHVIPRYSGPRQFAERTFRDAGWPGPPDLGRCNDTDPALNQRIKNELVSCWPRRKTGPGNNELGA